MRKRILWVLLVCEVLSTLAHATYSIVACDSQTKQCGVAVQTNNLAVGASVPYAEAGVGALASQFETNPNYGPAGLSLLRAGKSPDEALRQLLQEDGNFDGEGIEARQVGIVAIGGASAFYTGAEAAKEIWAGGRKGAGYSIQGNGLAGSQVAEAMEKTFLNTPGGLADRLMAALAAGDRAGGQKTGRESAALLVRTSEGFPMDIDLRVDDASDPVADLQKLYNMYCARQQLVQAAMAINKGELEKGQSLMIEAVARASEWPRALIRAAKLAEQIEEPSLALQYITTAFSKNPAWAENEIGSGDYAELGSDPLFHRWVTADEEHRALAAATDLQRTNSTKSEDYIPVSRMLLEVGRALEALKLLNDSGQGAATSVPLMLAKASAYSALGDKANSLKECRAAAALEPEDLRIRRKIRRLQSEGEPTH